MHAHACTMLEFILSEILQSAPTAPLTMVAYSKDGKLLNPPKPSRRRVQPPTVAAPNPTKGIKRSRRPSHWPADCLSSTGSCVRYAFRTWQGTKELPTAPWTPFPHQVAAVPEQDTDLPGDRYEMPWVMFFRMPINTSMQRYWSLLRNIPPHCEGVDKHLYTIHNLLPCYLRTAGPKISVCAGGSFWPTWPTGNGKLPGGTRKNLRGDFEDVQ
jgi:hypothetical protein